MNNRAIIFQRGGIASESERNAEAAALTAYIEREGLELRSIFVAAPTPTMTSIDVLIEQSMAWSKAGHIIVADLDHLWVGDGLGRVIERLASAGAIVHRVALEAP